MSNQEVPPWLKEQLERYEQLQQNLQSVLVQKQQVDLESIEIDKALEELNKSADDVKVYKSAGTVMVSSNKADVVKNLTDWGVFVDLNGVDALLHVTDMSYSRVKKPSDNNLLL